MSHPASATSRSAVVGLKTANAAPRWVFFAIFTISGFSGLIYESIWSHYLKLFLGHAAYAQSLVLIIFMGGLAFGSWLAARFSERWRMPILCYAIVEGVIGVIGLVFHGLFVGVSDAFYFDILPAIGNPAVGGALKWLAAAAIIAPQSVLLGMTFPLLSTGILRRYPDHPGGSLAMLYFTNSIGAAIGVLASGFWLIGLVGLPGTILTAGLLNIALALVVWILVKVDPQPLAAPLAPTHEAKAGDGSRLATLFFFAAGVTGAASFIYEIGWIRMLSLVLGSTTHSFELMLSAFITGLAFGGLWMKRRIDRIEDPVRFAGWVQVLMGVLAISTVPLYLQTFDWMAGFLSGLQKNDAGYTLFTAFSHGIALLVMVPTTFLAGMTLPLFTHVLLRAHRGEGAIGRVYAANTLGSILGVLFAVHVGMPLLGVKSLIGFGAVLDVLLGLLLLYRSGAGRQTAPLLRGALVGGIAIALVAVTVELDPRTLASGVYRYRHPRLNDETRILFYEDGKTASVSLIVQESTIIISTNGKPDASIEMRPERGRTSDEITMVMAAAVPLAYNPGTKTVANIGLGSGLTTHTFLGRSSIESVDTIEIESAMIKAARGFGERVSRTFSDPRSHIHLEDAKTFFSLQNRDYDIIIAEPSNPWVSGVASLFSEEFYRTVPSYLAPDGLFVQWLQLYEFDDRLAQSVLKSLSKTFSDFVIYHTDETNILIVAKVNGTLGTPSFDELLDSPLRDELAQVGLRTASDFLVRKTGSRRIVDAVLAGSPIPANSDYFPFLDLNAGRARFREQIATLFRSWAATGLPVLEMLGMEAFDYEAVGAAPRFYRTQMIDRARSVYASVVLGQPTSTPLGPEITVIELLGASCVPATLEEEQLSALHAVAQTSLASLASAEAAVLLEKSVASSCAPQRSERFRAWLDLYGAIAARDARRMAAAGKAVLRDESNDHADLQYALTATMLGEVASERPGSALQIWHERPPSLANLAPSGELELILKIAQNETPTKASH
jgi:spermidine synthase